MKTTAQEPVNVIDAGADNLISDVEIVDFDTKDTFLIVKFLLNEEYMEMEESKLDDTYTFKYAEGGLLERMQHKGFDLDIVSFVLHLAVMAKASRKIEGLMQEAIESIEEVYV